MLGNLIGGFIVIVVGVSLMPTVADEVYTARNFNSTGGGAGTSNVEGAASTILGLTTLFYALGIASASISIAAIGLRQAGLLGV